MKRETVNLRRDVQTAKAGEITPWGWSVKLAFGTFLQPMVDPNAWAKRHGIAPFEAPCHNCGALKITNVPIAKGRMRGLAAAPCGCGSESNTYCLVSVTGDILEELAR